MLTATLSSSICTGVSISRAASSIRTSCRLTWRSPTPRFARAELQVKTTETGRKFLLVNYHPLDKEEQPTHRLVVVDDTFEQKEDWLVFPAPNMRGYVALIGPGEKLVQLPTKYRDGKTTIVSKQRRAPSVPSFAQPIAGNRPFADAFAK